jgi:hypothetical protein
MRFGYGLLTVAMHGCAAAQVPATERTLPAPLFSHELPPDVPRPEGGVSAQAAQTCQDGDNAQIGGGILFSDETAAYVGRLRISYDELRALYGIDLRTMDRERGIYERTLQDADVEIQRQRQLAERSWWEQQQGVVLFVVGAVVGVGVAIGVLAAASGVIE